MRQQRTYESYYKKYYLKNREKINSNRQELRETRSEEEMICINEILKPKSHIWSKEWISCIEEMNSIQIQCFLKFL